LLPVVPILFVPGKIERRKQDELWRKDSNDASKIPTCWIDRDMMPQNFVVSAQVLHKHPVFENDVAGGHATKKHESRPEGKQQIAKEKHSRPCFQSGRRDLQVSNRTCFWRMPFAPQ
jgi:hypothetical protein